MDYGYFWKPYLSYYYDNTTVHFYDYYDALMISILLVSGVCVSLSAMIWAFYILYTHQKKGGRISAFIVLLIINDLAELLLSAVVASYVITSIVQFSATHSLKKIIEEQYITFNWFMLFREIVDIFRYLFITLRISGLYLHQLVALQCILFLKKQVSSAHVFSPLCSTITCIILWLLAFGCQFLNIWIQLFFIVLPSCFLAFTCILTYKASAAPDHIKPGSAVLIVSALTLITFCATAGVRIVFATSYFHRYIPLSAFLISLRTITDPLLCVLVSKEQFRVHQKTNAHTEEQ